MVNSWIFKNFRLDIYSHFETLASSDEDPLFCTFSLDNSLLNWVRKECYFAFTSCAVICSIIPISLSNFCLIILKSITKIQNLYSQPLLTTVKFCLTDWNSFAEKDPINLVSIPVHLSMYALHLLTMFLSLFLYFFVYFPPCFPNKNTI